MLASEASIVFKKICILLQKIAFSAFFVNCKNENGFFNNFAPFSNNLLSKLLHKIIGEKLLKNPFSTLQFTKKAEKANFWSEIQFFWETYFIRSQTFLSLSQTCLDTQ